MKTMQTGQFIEKCQIKRACRSGAVVKRLFMTGLSWMEQVLRITRLCRLIVIIWSLLQWLVRWETNRESLVHRAMYLSFQRSSKNKKHFLSSQGYPQFLCMPSEPQQCIMYAFSVSFIYCRAASDPFPLFSSWWWNKFVMFMSCASFFFF